MALMSTENKSACFPFLRLSAELRNRIYEEAFGSTIIFDKATVTPLDAGYSIILACKQTHTEALGLYYVAHTFRFSNNSRNGVNDIINRLDRWLDTIGQGSAQVVNRIEMDLAPRLRFSLLSQARIPYWSEERVMDLAATVATAYISNRMANHRLRHGVVLASICSPLDGEHYTSDPRTMLEQHRKVLKFEKLGGANEREQTES